MMMDVGSRTCDVGWMLHVGWLIIGCWMDNAGSMILDG